MPTLNPATRAQLYRLARLTVITLASAPVVIAAVHAWELRYPLLGVVIGLCEVIWRTVAPVVPAPPPVARHAGPDTITDQQLTRTSVPAPTAEQVYTPVAADPKPDTMPDAPTI